MNFKIKMHKKIIKAKPNGNIEIIPFQRYDYTECYLLPIVLLIRINN